MPVVGFAELAPIRRCLEIAAAGTGQSRRAADFPLGWPNAGRGGFDLTDLRAVGKTRTRRGGRATRGIRGVAMNTAVATMSAVIEKLVALRQPNLAMEPR
jgi:hypothetical protein